MTTALDVRGLTRRFGNDLAVDGVDLTVRHGEIHAIVGLNGAGKTTLMRLLLGMLRPDAGEAKVLGQDSIAAGPEVWSKVGHLIETPFAYPELSVRENVMASASLGGLSLEDAAASADRVIHQFELTAWTSRRAAHLSLGNRQRLGLASALVHGPSVLVLDEPANALDPAGVVFTRGLLRQLANDGAAVFVSSHHFDQLARVAHSITVLHRGRVVGSLEPDGVDLEQRFFDLVHQSDLATGTAR